MISYIYNYENLKVLVLILHEDIFFSNCFFCIQCYSFPNCFVQNCIWCVEVIFPFLCINIISSRFPAFWNDLDKFAILLCDEQSFRHIHCFSRYVEKTVWTKNLQNIFIMNQNQNFQVFTIVNKSLKVLCVRDNTFEQNHPQSPEDGMKTKLLKEWNSTEVR